VDPVPDRLLPNKAGSAITEAVFLSAYLFIVKTQENTNVLCEKISEYFMSKKVVCIITK
jgi:hypothetical protein